MRERDREMETEIGSVGRGRDERELEGKEFKKSRGPEAEISYLYVVP